MFWLCFAITAVAGYLLGNLNGAILISRLVMKEDVRTKGSGNAGLTNFHRSYGGLSTFLVLGIDVAKAVAAALLGGWLLGWFGQADLGRMLGGTCTVLGHMFPVAFQFRGGKGILSAAALAAVMDWRLFLALLVLFIVVVYFTKYVSLGSCLGAVLFVPAFFLLYPGQWALIGQAILLAVLVLYKHRSNIRRLLKGEENKLSFQKKAKS